MLGLQRVSAIEEQVVDVLVVFVIVRLALVGLKVLPEDYSLSV
jgi:hypothetical protein